MADAWADAAAWDGMTKIGGGEAPAAVAGAVGLNEVVAHGWDLARATGQTFAPAIDDVDACIEVMAPMSQPGMDAVREPAFGPVVEPSDERVSARPAARAHRSRSRLVRLIVGSACHHVGTPTPGGDMNQQSAGGSDGSRISGGAIATLGGLAVLAIFVVQNTEDVKFKFLMVDFTWPLWLYTIVVALVGALVWFGLGVIRRHRRRKERRDDRRD